jgi:hypothetical protein
MRPSTSFILTALLTCAACTGVDNSKGTDPVDTETTEGETDEETEDTDEETEDTELTDLPDLDADFTENGPGEGYHWFLEPAPVDAPVTRCGVGTQNSFNFYADTWQLQSSSPSLMQFGIALQATPGGTLVCDYTNDGRFTCSTTSYGQDLSALPPPYSLDAYVTMTTTATGRFVEREGTDPTTQADHTYSPRWAANLNLTFAATCTGTQCSSAAAGMGSNGFPCESTFTGLESVNYSDPTLADPG